MIVCSCQHISDKDVLAAVDWMRAADKYALITPSKIYRALGKTPECGGCMKLFVASMRKSPKLEIPAELRGLRNQPDIRSNGHEGRRESH